MLFPQPLNFESECLFQFETICQSLNSHLSGYSSRNVPAPPSRRFYFDYWWYVFIFFTLNYSSMVDRFLKASCYNYFFVLF